MKIKQIWFLSLLITAVLVIEGLTLLHKPKVTIQKDYLLLEESVKQNSTMEVVTEEEVVLRKGRLSELLQQSAVWENRIILAELELELLGTAVGNIKDPIAFIKDLETGNQGMYKQGNVVKDAKIISIAMGEVVVDRKGHREVLRLSNRARAWANMDESDSPIIAVSGDKIVVSKRSALKETPKIYNTLRKVKVKPYYQSDKVIGLVVDGITKGSLIEEAGIRNKDIIKTVNNQRVDSYQKALQVFRKAITQKEISLDLLRNGENKRLSYQLDL